MIYRFISGAAAAVMLFSAGEPAAAYADESSITVHDSVSEEELFDCAYGIISYEKNRFDIPEEDSIFSGEFLLEAGEPAADWLAAGISRMGFHEDYGAYYSALSESVCEMYENGVTENPKATDWHRAALTVLSCGEDPSDAYGFDLIGDGVYGRTGENSPGEQGLNGWIWSLAALDSLSWKTPENVLYDRKFIIEKILSAQLGNGGFSMSGSGEGETDLTAMAVQALAPYYNDGSSDEVRTAVEKALDFLSENQRQDGGFGSCESDAQALCALCSAGVDIFSDERFVKDRDLLESMLGYQNDDGGFSHEKGGKSDSLASAQALLAVAAVTRYQCGMRRIFDFHEEFSHEDRERLEEINLQLVSLDGEESVKRCISLYSQLDPELQSYVRNYKRLLTAAEENGLSVGSDDLTAMTGAAESGKGCIYDIKNDMIYSPSGTFTDSDRKNYDRMYSDGALSTDALLCGDMLERLEASEDIPYQEKKAMADNIRRFKKQAEDNGRLIDDINREIMDGLYPFENISGEQQEKINGLYKRAQSLPETDRDRITGYQQLEMHHEEEPSLYEKRHHSKGVLSAAALGVIAFVTLARRLGERKKRHE